ncbi:MFS transporter [Shimia ponticola]|uniref:MFS transporter n=1 Tax=Shimia ponticola TaxID=2582893 RepID=UPI0011BF5FF0|nr:MFS transporter [Shimia ponticola]
MTSDTRTDASASASASSAVITVLSAGNFVIGMGAFLVVGVIEPIADDLSVTPTAAGGLLTTYALAYAVLSPVLVALTGQLGRRRVLAGGLAIFGIASALAALAPDFLTLNLTRILAAAGAGVVTPVAAAVAAGLSPPERRARTLAAVFFGLTLAQVLGIPAGSFVAYTFGWQWAFWSVFLLALPCVIAVWRTVPAGLSFQPVALRNLGSVLKDGPMMLAILFTATFLGSIYVLYTFMAPLLSSSMGFGRNGITAVLLVFGLGAVLGNLLGGRLADRFGAAQTLIVLAVLQTLMLPFYSYLPVPAWLLYSFTLIWSIAGWSFAAGQQLRLVQLGGTQAQVALSLNAAAIYVGAAVGSAIGGAVVAGYGVNALGFVAGIGCLISVIHIITSYKLSG